VACASTGRRRACSARRRPTTRGSSRRPGERFTLDGDLPPAGARDLHSEPVPGGRGGASGTGRADGGAVGLAGGAAGDGRARFDQPVVPGGYAWWYIDALSEDGTVGLTVIAFVGSVFSPYYARAIRRGAAEPENHVAINAVVYGPRAKRWAMTERGADALHRSASHVCVGPSSLRWCGDDLVVEIDEWSVPVPLRLKGTIRVRPRMLAREEYALDAAGRHRWRPIAPVADVECRFSSPGIAFRGHGYVDTNSGSEPLAAAFRSWTWSRGIERDRTLIAYDVEPRHGHRPGLGLACHADGRIEPVEPPPSTALPAGPIWRVARSMRSDAGNPAESVRTFEDTPFYTRSLVDASWQGRRHPAMVESVDLDRFVSPWVQMLLPFRMPRLG
jgi:carotenoid 1,2-hydratase